MRHPAARVSGVLLLLFVGTVLHAQQSPRPGASSVPRVMQVSGVFVPANGQPPASVESVTIAIYADEQGGTPLWEETQEVAVDSNGRYSILLGATRPEGLPQELFASGQARWMSRRVERAGEREQARVLITSVPYALKATDADTLGGRPATDYLLAGSAVTGAAAGIAQEPLPTANLTNPSVTNNIPKYVNSVDLGASSIFDTGGLVGVNTASPLDTMHLQFTNTNGAMTGLAVQNLGSTATSYSGMLFYDQNGALGQFQGFNNSTHEYRINNIASGGSINFMIGSSSKFRVANTGTVEVSAASAAGRLTVGPIVGGESFAATSGLQAMGPTVRALS